MKRALLCAVLLIILSGCGQAEPHSVTLFAMDTVMELTVYGEGSLLDEAQAIIAEGEQRLSVTESGSEIAALNREGANPISPKTEELLRQAQALCEQTGGALDISIYPVVRAWGFTTGEYRVPGNEELAGLLPLVDYQKLQIKEGRAALSSGMQIDLGSVAKGWMGDKVLELFRQSGVKSALLNLGGNVQALGTKPDGSSWRVAVRDPAGEGYAGALEVTDKAVVTSGGYQRYIRQNPPRFTVNQDGSHGDFPVIENLQVFHTCTLLFFEGKEGAARSALGGFPPILTLGIRGGKVTGQLHPGDHALNLKPILFGQVFQHGCQITGITLFLFAHKFNLAFCSPICYTRKQGRG